MTNAEHQRKVFWELFVEELRCQENPFSIKHKDYFATVNKNSSVSTYCLSIDFMYRGQYLRAGIYMLDNIPAFEQMYSHKEEIEASIGARLDWVMSGDKQASVRRIKIDIPFVKNDVYSYAEAAKKAIYYVTKMREIFPKYSPECLFDY